MKTLIAIPCMDNLPLGFVRSLLELRKNADDCICFKSNSLVYDARNILSLTAIEQKYDRVLWLDSDMMFSPYLLERLSHDMDAMHCDLVTGLYFRRTLPTSPVLFRRIDEPQPGKDGKPQRNVEEYTDYPQDAFFQIDGCGFGAVLTTTDLLKRVWDSFGPAFYPFPWGGEDISFCYRAKLLGAKMFCDSSIKAGHIGYIQYTEHMYVRE